MSVAMEQPIDQVSQDSLTPDLPNNPSDPANPADPPRTARKDRYHFGMHGGIYLRAPVLMIFFFFVGIIASLGHHGYYSSLHGDRVGTEAQQQWSLRFVTFYNPILLSLLGS